VFDHLVSFELKRGSGGEIGQRTDGHG
jgi:hypothetical protein